MRRVLIVLMIGFVAVCEAMPQSGELRPEIVDDIDRLITEKMEEDRIPGLSVAVVEEGELVWSEGYGRSDLENDVPSRPETVYRTASVGKSMTAVAVMQLVEAGEIDLDKPIQSYCPSFPQKRWTITTRHLLGHMSGIRHYGGPNEEAELFNTVHYENVVTALDIFANDPLQFEPATEFQYSTFGYNVLGCVIEGASGKPYRSYMQEEVFAPAGMEATRDDDPRAIIEHRAQGYQPGPDGALFNARDVDMSSKLPAGGFVTTAEDLVRFAAAFMDHRLVEPGTAELMLTPVRLEDGETGPFGLGWGLFPGETWYGEREAFHGGMTPGVSAMLYLLPDRRFAVAIMTNLEGVSGRTQLAAEIARLILELDS